MNHSLGFLMEWLHFYPAPTINLLEDWWLVASWAGSTGPVTRLKCLLWIMFQIGNRLQRAESRRGPSAVGRTGGLSLVYHDGTGLDWVLGLKINSCKHVRFAGEPEDCTGAEGTKA